MREKLVFILFLVSFGLVQAQTPNKAPLYAEQAPALNSIGVASIMAMPAPTPKIRIGLAFHDTNVDCSHPDLRPNLDLASSRNFVGGDICDDHLQHHGTMMAGVAAHGLKLAGIWDGPYFMLSLLRQDGGSYAPEAQGGDYAVQMFLHTLTAPYDLVILNDSSGGFNTDEHGGFARLRPTLRAIREKTLDFFAAGNAYEGGMAPDITTWPGNLPQVSGCNDSDLDNVICVGSVEPDGRMSSFSYYGSKVNLGTLGESVLTTCPLDYCTSNWATNPGYLSVSGTSISSALAAASTAAVVAQFSSEYPEISLTPALVKRAVLEGSCFDPWLLSSDPRTFALPARFCADGSLTWLRRYASNTLAQAQSTQLKVAGASDSFTGSPVLKAGSWVSVYGSGFSDTELDLGPYGWASYGMRPDTAHVWCNGVEAHLNYVSPNQVNALLPASCYDGRPGTTNRLVIGRSNRFGEINPSAVAVAAEGFELVK